MAGVSSDPMIPCVADVATHVSPMSRLMTMAGRGRIRTFDLLIQRTPNDLVDRRCGLSVVRTRLLSIRRAIRLNMPDGVR